MSTFVALLPGSSNAHRLTRYDDKGWRATFYTRRVTISQIFMPTICSPGATAIATCSPTTDPS